MLTPVAARANPYIVVALRVVMGLALVRTKALSFNHHLVGRALILLNNFAPISVVPFSSWPIEKPTLNLVGWNHSFLLVNLSSKS